MNEEFHKEFWKEIKGYEGYYSISNFGRVKRIKGGPGAQIGKILKIENRSTGSYVSADLCKEGKTKTFQAHVLVLETFVGSKPTYKHECNHIDGNKKNNNLYNLEWATHVDNCIHRHDVLKKAKGENHYKAKECLVTTPEGTTFMIKGLRQFCKKNGISSSKMSDVARGIANNHKGWKCVYV